MSYRFDLSNVESVFITIVPSDSTGTPRTGTQAPPQAAPVCRRCQRTMDVIPTQHGQIWQCRECGKCRLIRP